jgi:hypothetical protein
MSSSVIQAVLFREIDCNLKNSLKWLENNHFKPKKVDRTNNLFRYRLLEPLDLKKKGYTQYANKFIEDESIILVIAYK